MKRPLVSRLPDVGTTIFTVMSQLATELGAVNLGQGFPDFDCDPQLQALVTDAMRAGQASVNAIGVRISGEPNCARTEPSV